MPDSGPTANSSPLCDWFASVVLVLLLVRASAAAYGHACQSTIQSVFIPGSSPVRPLADWNQKQRQSVQSGLNS